MAFSNPPFVGGVRWQECAQLSSFREPIADSETCRPFMSPKYRFGTAGDGTLPTFLIGIVEGSYRVNPTPDVRIVIAQLPSWLAHYTEVHPHKALGYRSPREFIARSTQENPSSL